MREIFKTLKKSLFAIILVILLLVLQARCDLSLPDYTANIVNVGIQQNGIDSSVLKVLRKTTMEKLLLFTTSKQDEEILSNYKLINKYSKNYSEYKILKKEEVYVLKDEKKLKDKDLQKTMAKSIVLYSFLSNKDNVEKLIKDNNTGLTLPNNIDVFSALSYLNDEQIEKITSKFDKSYNKMGDSLIIQSAIPTIQKEYKEVGVDINKLQINYIIIAGAKMIFIALIGMIVTILTIFLSSRIAAKFGRDIRNKVVTKIISFSNKEFEDFSTASLITRSTNDIQQIQMFIVMFFRIVVFAPILGLGALSKVSGSSLSWIIGLAVSIIFILVITLFSIALPKFKLVQKLIDKLNLISRETLTGLPVIRAFANEKHEEQRFDKANKDLMNVNLFVNKIMMILMPSMTFVMNGVSILIIWVGASKVDVGTLQVGNLIAFITYSMQIIMSFLMLAMISIMIPRAIISIKRIKEIFNKEISIKEKENVKDFDRKQKGIIEFKDVYFRYPDASEDVLQNINFKTKAGTTTAIIGSTGSGKSTLINLIPRFFDVTSGKILIDGVNIKDVSLKNLRSKIGYVPQKGILFSGTIKSNIAFGKKINDKKIQEAIEIAQAKEFVLEKEKGLDSKISQGGTNVSGGQKQRLSIARALAREPEILIFDDSFSALDFKTDAKLRKALKNKTKNQTIIIVAQRISTVLNAEQIIVLNEGHIVGVGTHKELLKNCEVYKEIALSQLGSEELGI